MKQLIIFIKAWVLSNIAFDVVCGIVNAWNGDTRSVLTSVICFVINVMVMEFYKAIGLWNKF
jgi:hypothetical protein